MVKDKSKLEKYVEKYLIEKGFKVTLMKQYNSKTVYQVFRNGVESRLEVPFAVTDAKRYMDSVFKGLVLKEELKALNNESKQL